MKKLLFIPICCLYACTVWSQNTDTLNQKDAEGSKQGYWIYYGADRPESGYALEVKVQEGNYLNNRKEGMWISYHKDGKTPKFIGEYSNNRPVGSYKKYYESGMLKETGNFTRNQYHDSLIRYFENGQREYAAWYDSTGREHGLVRHWNPDGTLELEYTANHGSIPPSARHIPHGGCDGGKYGLEIVYAKPGSLKNHQPEQAIVKEHVEPTPAPVVGSNPQTHGVKWNPDSNNKVYNQDDEIWQDGTFRNGKLWNGKVYVYDQDGILLKVKIYREGVYYADGQL